MLSHRHGYIAEDSCRIITWGKACCSLAKTMHIRKMTQADTPAIDAILRDVGHFPYFQKTPFEETIRTITTHLTMCLADNSHSMFVAENDDGVVVGYTAVHWIPYLLLKGPDGYVSELFVAASERGKGIGAQLLEVVKAEGRQRGCSRLSLLNLRERESYQRGFYKKQGWTERENMANFVFPFD